METKLTILLITLIQILTFEGSFAVPTKQPSRNAKFMAFSAQDVFTDFMDDMQDPLPPMGSINEKEKSYIVNDTVSTTTLRPSKVNDTKMLPLKTEEKIALYNQNTGKFELITSTSGHFSFPLKPVTESGGYFYGNQHYQYRRPDELSQNGNRTDEIKIFWSSVGDAVENIPFLPIQINVPDMFSAMTTFLANYIPFINRLANPNHPRLPYQVVINQNETTSQHPDYYETYYVDQMSDNSIKRRDFENGGVKLKNKSNKKRKKNKRKSNKKKKIQRGSERRIFPVITSKDTTLPPPEDIKLWQQFGNDQKERIRFKNMPISAKRVRVHDREVFNFKNSDISNSPIMILNIPHRPLTQYKFNNKEVREGEPLQKRAPKIPVQTFQPQKLTSQTPQERSQSKRRRKLKNDTEKTPSTRSTSSKRSGRSDNIETTETSTATPI